MFKFAIIFLVISLIAGALGLTNVSRVAKRISLVLFALFSLLSSPSSGLPCWSVRRLRHAQQPRQRLWS